MVKRIRFFYHLFFAVIKKEWKKIFVFSLSLGVIVFAVLFLSKPALALFSNTTGKLIKPVYIEALVGKPTTFNPLFSKLETEKEINSLVFRGLIKIGPDGTPITDLADRYEIKNDVDYKFYLKKNIYWQDGEKFTADDVVYTIQTGQNSLYNSEIAETFQDVIVSKIDDYTVNFHLKEPFSPFLSALTVGIIPKHIPLSNYRPIGTGEFKFIDVKPTYSLLEGSKYRIKFQYYPTLETAEAAIKLGQAHGLSNYGSHGNNFEDWQNFQVQETSLAFQEVVAFFNLRNDILKEKMVRQALAYATPKEAILSNSFGKKGTLAVNSLPNLTVFQKDASEKYPYNLDKAATLLSNSGWVLKDNFRYKDNKKLSFTITTIDDPEFTDTAIKLRDSFRKIGVDVDVVIVSGLDLKNQIVPNRDFAVLVTSQLLGTDPDQYVLWHTTQTRYSNISGIATAKIDKLLEDGRKTSDPKVRADKYQEFTRILLDEEPAVFLYYPRYVWLVSKRISGIDLKNFRVPIDRFESIDKWTISKPLI